MTLALLILAFVVTASAVMLSLVVWSLSLWASFRRLQKARAVLEFDRMEIQRQRGRIDFSDVMEWRRN